MRLLIIHWHDAGSGMDEDEAAGHFRSSVGWEMKNNKKGIWISMEDDALSGVHFIPRGMLLSVVHVPISFDTE